jgi:lysophospholipase L1-like esterase
MLQKLSRRKFIKSTALASIATSLPIGNLIAKTKFDNIEPKSEVKNLVFLFQGDSITDGNRGRNNDPNHIMGHGYAFSVASRIGADFPNEGFKFYNRGISGNTIFDLQKRWQTDTLDLKPDILSILIGINDVDQSINNPATATGHKEFELAFRDILTQSKNSKPDIIFVLSLPFVYQIGNRKENWELWSNGTSKRAEIVKKLASEFQAVLIDYPAVFNKAMKNTPPDYWIWDGIHPTVFGHELMAREWIKQTATRLHFLKKYKY